MPGSDKVLCRTPTEGKRPTRIERFKFEAVRRAILQAIDEAGGEIDFKPLPRMVEDLLTQEERDRLGSAAWYTTTVKLELEVAGEIERVPGVSPQRLRRT